MSLPQEAFLTPVLVKRKVQLPNRDPNKQWVKQDRTLFFSDVKVLAGVAALSYKQGQAPSLLFCHF
jgi:hypothetical protein